MQSSRVVAVAHRSSPDHIVPLVHGYRVHSDIPVEGAVACSIVVSVARHDMRWRRGYSLLKRDNAMTPLTTENPDVVARIRNPVVDAWNDAPLELNTARTLDDGLGALGPPHSLNQSTWDTDTTAAPPDTRVPAQAVGIASVATDETLSRWVPVLGAVALFVCFAAVQEAITSGARGDLSSARFRFGIVGTSAPALFKLMLGVSLATVAVLATQRRILATIVSWMLRLQALVMLALVPIFLLDAIQVRPSLPDRLAGNAMIVNCAFVLLYFAGAAAVSIVCARALRSHARRFVVDKQAVAKAWDR